MKKIYAVQRVLACLFFSLSFTAFSYAQSFNATGLNGENLNNPTSLDFGPNGKLYVSQQDGTLFEYTVLRDNASAGSGSYGVTETNTINVVKTGTPNHNDDGTINTSNKRQVTGLLATGTQTTPVLYVSSSDSRIGGAGGGTDTNLDTNSGVLSRLTWTGSNWDKVDLVRGLPRCEENHSTNGMEIFERNGSTYLLLQQGGNANKGAPSNNFAGTSETYLSAALLIVNLTQLEQMEAANGGPYIDTRQGSTKYIYDLPTLNDPDRADITNSHPNFPYPASHPMYNATIDLGDPFGGNNGLNQAFPEAGGPVQIFSTGWRNGYDVVITADGRIYSVDNGPNTTWGGLPVIYDSNGQRKGDQSNTTYNPAAGDYITNEFNEVGSSGHGDALHYVGNVGDTNGSYYAGHPTPIRAFPSRAGVIEYSLDAGNWVITANRNFGDLLAGVSGYFNTGFDISDFPDDPIQGEYLATATSDSRMRIFDIVNASTNGMCEYTASNFDGAMQGDLLTASYNNGRINRYQLNTNGDGIDAKNNFFLTGFGSEPLDVIAQGDTDPFPGTIWAATYGADNITVFEPSDFGNCPQPTDPGYVGTEDYDFDGYTNDDEVSNGTDICSGGSRPTDNDGDNISDLNDADDDNDGIADNQDVFALDANNGTTTNLPIEYPFWNNDPGTGLFGLGFTGLMLDPSGSTNYLDQYDGDNLSFGGAGGKATIDAVGIGGAEGTVNSQENGFQFGVNVDSNSSPFTVHSKIETPFAGTTPNNSMSYGIFIGNGDQDHYLKVVIMEGVADNDDIYGIEVLREGGIPNLLSQKYDVPGILDAGSVDIYISVDPTANTAQPYYSIDGGENAIALGNPVTLPSSLLDANDDRGMAVGLISTSSATGQEFTATWDFLNVVENGTAALTLSDNPIDFGILETGSGQVQLIPTLTNEGGPSTGAIEITGITITGSDATLFSNDTNLPLTIGPGADKTLPLNFFPNNSPGTKTADLEIVHTGTNSPFIVPLTAILEDNVEPVYEAVARINAGGDVVAATDGMVNWEANLGDGAVNGPNYSVNTGVIPGFDNNFLFENRHTSIPDYIDETTFNSIFLKERYDATSGEEMEFKISVPDGEYIVNIYTGNSYAPANNIGDRIFDILVENELRGDDIDVVALFGNGTDTEFHAGMLSYGVTVADGELNVRFEHTGAENPVLQAMEIMGVSSGFAPITIAPIADQYHQVNEASTLAVSATGGDTQENFTYALFGQPDGIGIESTNGQIFGNISEAALTGGPNNDGIHNVIVEVSKPGSETKSIDFVWTVASLKWQNKDENENYTARHECSLVQAGDKFYLMGGRENAKTIDVYDYTTDTWTQITDSPPVEFNHFQATEYKGLIWVIGAFTTNNFPSEQPAEYVWAFDPVNEEWIQGPEIPENRRRGSAGLVIHNDKFYIAGGNTIGHDGGYVNWFDEYDPSTGTWTPLTDAPRARDHFHAGVVDNKLYLVGGRLSGNAGGVFNPTIAEVDVYDFASGTWSTLPTDQNLPTPRAAASVANFNGRLLVIGGEVDKGQVYGEEVTDALKITEAYDPVTQTWTRLPDLNSERHGTQAIVSGNGVFVLAGSPKKGGGNQKNMEYLGEDSPVGVPNTASTLTAADIVDIAPGSSSDFTLQLTGGNMGMIIRSMELTGTNAANFTISSGELQNTLLAPESSHQITVSLDNAGQGTNAVLTINYGATSSLNIVLKNGELSSGIINPGTQYNKEGDAIALPIETNSDAGDLTFSATGLPPTLTIDADTGIISGTVLAAGGSGAFLEQNGLVVVEAESGNVVPGWTQTSADGATGILAGSNSFGGQGGGTIPYQVTVSTPGVYRFDWRSFYSGPSPTDENDNWLRFPNNDDVWFFGYQGNLGDEATVIANLQATQDNVVFPKGSSRITLETTPEGSGSNGYFKIYRSGGESETYDWQARTSDNDAHDIYVWFVNPGTFTFEISERSSGHAIDKMVLYKLDGPSYSDSQLTAAPESDRQTESAGAEENSPYQVIVTATDEVNPANSSTEEFTWIIDNSGNPVAEATATPLEGNAPLEVYFTGSGSVDDIEITEYLWEFGDALSSESALADPTFTFTEAGTFNVSLTVTDADGQTDSKFVEIVVHPTPVHTITATADANGTISPSGEIAVTEGSDQTFNIEANEGYVIADIQVDGVSQGAINSYVFEQVAASHTITASFKVATYTIVATAGLGGNIDPNGTTFVAHDSDMGYAILPDSGYRIVDVIVDGVSQGNIGFFEFTAVVETHTIFASFEAIPTYTITASATQGGTISPQGVNIGLEGDSIGFTAMADTGFAFDHFLVDGIFMQDDSDYNFENITENHTIEAVFTPTSKRTKHTIRATATAGGTLSPFGTIDVFEGEGQSFTIMADAGFELTDILVDGIAIEITDTYTFDEVTEDHSMEVVFSEIIVNQAPNAVAISDVSESFAPLAVNFNGSDSTDDKAIAEYVWDFGDGSSVASGVIASHTYTTPGVYTATLTVTDSAGETSNASVVITVNEAPPTDASEDIELRLFPNPASIQITLGFTKSINLKSIYIYDMGGRLMKAFDAKQLLFDGRYVMDVSSLSQGLYFISTEDTDGNEFHEQMVIKR